jgi:hypothetical protein
MLRKDICVVDKTNNIIKKAEEVACRINVTADMSEDDVRQLLYSHTSDSLLIDQVIKNIYDWEGKHHVSKTGALR